MKADPLEPKKAGFDTVFQDFGGTRLTEAAKTRRLAWFLSLAGFIPFAFLASGLLILDANNPLRPLAIDGLKTYAAIILSFLGGIRWGLAMKASEPEKERLSLLLSVVPAIVGWISIFVPEPYVFGILILAFSAHGAWDSFAGQKGVFGLWFVKLRTVLTFIVVASLAVGFFVTV